MSPEDRTPSPLGLPARGEHKKIGRLASVALVVAIGLVTPAAALAHGMTGHKGVTHADGPRCDNDPGHHPGGGGGDHGKDECKTPTPTPTPTPPPPTGCNDIDSAVQGMTKYVSVICDGQVRVLSVNEAGQNPPTPVGGWQLVGGPTNVFDATLAVFDNELLVTELTDTGEVWQGVCTSTLPLTVPCTFTQMPTPPNGSA
ncbi:hypothetical protein ACH4UM_14170 [Streptomyces sp. NPDC020801]|uniref:hypothetical protein n=1 Tax=unclassified Streptomyces TaxID=2593676 RepID=UPI00378F5A43